MSEITYEFIYYYTDESFDYDAPWGIATQYDRCAHGFDVKINENDNVDMDSLCAYGHFDNSDFDKAKTAPSEFIKFIEKSKNEINIGNFDGNLTEDILDELISFVSKLKDKAA